MKLYLSSYRVPTPSDLFALIGKRPDQTKVAIIPNAKDYYAEKPRAMKTQDVVDYFSELGVSAEVVDLNDYSNPNVLKEKLKTYDLVWVNGGNTFMLRHQLRRSGFEKVIAELIESGVVYGGESAGALVAGNSLKGIEDADEARFADELIWDGLALVDKFVLPHVGNSPYGAGIDKAREAHSDDPTLVELTDTQAYVVNGDQAKVVTA